MTVTDDLVKWLRDEASFAYDREDMGMLNQAADRIEALTAENERLRETLARVCLVKQHTMNPAHTIQRMQQIARAALEGKQ